MSTPDVVGGDRDPAWSPDGRSLVWARTVARTEDFGVVRELFVMNRDGGDVRQVTRTGRDLRKPAWSPDGTLIAFEDEFDVRVVALDGSGLRTVAPTAYDPAWHPDGRTLTFVTERDGGSDCAEYPDHGCYQAFELYEVGLDGSGERRLTPPGNVVFASPSWAPDGRRLVASCSGGLCLVDREGQRVEEFRPNPTTDPGHDAAPVWSPDGQQLAFERPDKPGELNTVSLQTRELRAVGAGLAVDWQRQPDSPAPPPPPPPTAESAPPPPLAKDPPKRPSLSVARWQRAGVVRARGARLRLRCRAACSARLELEHRRRAGGRWTRIGVRRVRFSSSARRTIRLRAWSESARRLLRVRRGRSFRIRAVVTTEGTAVTVLLRRLTLVR